MDSESMLKGRMAESLVEDLLRSAGNQVYHFGYEYILQNLTQLEKAFDRYSEVGEQIRSIPDFLIVNKGGKPVLVKVKFRWESSLHENDIGRLERINRFWKAALIFVNCSEKPYFRISYPPYVDAEKKLVAESLFENEELGLKDLLIKPPHFDSLVEKYFSVTLRREK